MVRQHDRLAATVGRIAAAIATIVALVLPAGYFALSCQYQIGAMRSEAGFNATLATQYVALNPELWRFQQVRLQGMLEHDATDTELPERRRILDEKNTVIASSSGALSAPAISVRAPLHDAGKVVGQLEVARSLRPLLLKTGLVALLGLALAAAVFGTLKLLPLRALNRALDSLRQSERLFSSAFHASPDPIIVSRARDGRILSVNGSFSRLTGYAPDETVGHSSAELELWPDISVLAEATQTLGAKGSVRNLACGLSTKSGETRETLLSAEMTEINDEICILTVMRDVTEQKSAERRLAYLASYDSLTGLPNRALFRDRLAQAMQRADRTERLVTLMFLDLDRFKAVNDSLGHAVGDELLRQVAHRLSDCLRGADTVSHDAATNTGATVARLGGDEFTLIVEDVGHIDEVTRIAQRVLAAFSAPFLLAGHEFFISASIGITVYPFDDTDLDNLLRDADVAMYRAKALGRNNFQFFTDDLNANAEERLWLETELRQALEHGQFEIHYQPKLDLRSNLVTGMEALLRWRHPQRGLVYPNDFIPLLEELGLIVPVGEWVLATACRQAVAWTAAGLPPLQLAVNLSPRQFRDERLTARIHAVLAQSGLAPSRLELEITESLLMEDSAASQTALAGIKAMGVKISMDDFGTGYSSLAYLKRFPLDTLKIDRSFVKDAGLDQEDTAIIRGILALARSLGLKVVAEGVETADQLALLRDARCDQAQGYLIARPMDAAGFRDWFADQCSGQMTLAGTGAS